LEQASLLLNHEFVAPVTEPPAVHSSCANPHKCRHSSNTTCHSSNTTASAQSITRCGALDPMGLQQ
jgi:hypothetical protein